MDKPDAWIDPIPGAGLFAVLEFLLALLDASDRQWHSQLMRYALNDIQAGKLARELERIGIDPEQRVSVLIECKDSADIPITAINADGGAFDWLEDEPDLYSDQDLIERYR